MKNQEITKILNFFFCFIWFKFSKILNLNLKKTLLRGKATLPLWFEPSHDYVGPAVTEPINEPVGLIRAGFSAVGLFLGQKLKISQEQNVKEFQFYIHMQNFRLLGSIIKKKYPKIADPLNIGIQFLRIIGVFPFRLTKLDFRYGFCILKKTVAT